MTVLDGYVSPFPERPPWSGIGAAGWDGTTGPDDLRLVSASSIPKALASPALERWAITRTVEEIAARIDEFKALVDVDIEAAVAWADQLRYAPEGDNELNAADGGTALHHVLECWLKSEKPDERTVAQIQRDPELTAMAQNLWDWYCRFKPQLIASEIVVYDPALGIAGRLDAIVIFPTLPHLGTTLVDLKNSRKARYKSGGKKKVYGDSHALQLCSYRNAPLTATFEPRVVQTQTASANRVYLLNRAELAACAPSIEIQSTCILQNNPETCRLYPLETGPAVQRRVIEARGLHEWINEEAKGVVGQPIFPPLAIPDLNT